jgi:hypothetical protein
MKHILNHSVDGMLGSARRRVGWSLAIASVAITSAGCSAPSSESIASEQQAIGGNWRAFGQTSSTFSGGLSSDPAVCDAHADSGAWVAFGRAPNNKIYMNFFQKVPFPQIPAESGWLKQTDTTFTLKPACAALDGLYDAPQSQWNYQKIIVARSPAPNNRYMYRIVKLGPPSQSTPVTIQNWVNIGTAAYVSAPAAGVINGQLLVCGLRSDARMWCYRNTLNLANPAAPLSAANWLPGLQAPALPSPWVAQGDPAFADTSPWTSQAMIAIRATRTNPSQTLFFFTTWNGSSYSPWVQFPAPPSGVSIGSDPAMSVDIINLWGATLAFRGTDGKIYEGSGIGTVGWSWSAINAAGGTNTGFSGTPAMAGSLNGWEGENLVFARKSGQYWNSSPCPQFGGC